MVPIEVMVLSTRQPLTQLPDSLDRIYDIEDLDEKSQNIESR